jgi:hypothetical protein
MLLASDSSTELNDHLEMKNDIRRTLRIFRAMGISPQDLPEHPNKQRTMLRIPCQLLLDNHAHYSECLQYNPRFEVIVSHQDSCELNVTKNEDSYGGC